MSSSTAVTLADMSDEPQAYEDEHVHAIYERIAPHFSSTRYKPWPIVAQFISSLPTGWIGLDSGTGNGKYLPLPLDRPRSIWTIGLDRSKNLLAIAKYAGSPAIREVVCGDVLGGGWRIGVFDYAISIATIHHLASPDRRKLAVQRLLESVSPMHGRLLIYVWAVEQDALSKRAIPTSESSDVLHESEENGQDVFVPWVFSNSTARAPPGTESKKDEPEQDEVYQRYYHMFSSGELNELVRNAALEIHLTVGPSPLIRDEVRGMGVAIMKEGWERSNYYIELRRWKC